MYFGQTQCSLFDVLLGETRNHEIRSALIYGGRNNWEKMSSILCNDLTNCHKSRSILGLQLKTMTKLIKNRHQYSKEDTENAFDDSPLSKNTRNQKILVGRPTETDVNYISVVFRFDCERFVLQTSVVYGFKIILIPVLKNPFQYLNIFNL